MGTALAKIRSKKLQVDKDSTDQEGPPACDVTKPLSDITSPVNRDITDMPHDVPTTQVGDEVDGLAAEVDISKHVYPFENLVFEGGGTKGLAYCGAIKVLEDLDIMKNVKRFAGTSAGAITAALLAVEFKSDDIRDFVNEDMKKILLDHSLGFFSLIPNMARNYGWNPATRLHDWFGKKLEGKGLDKDITFATVHKKFGKELCIVVTNVNMMTAEYFHLKTTPNMAIRDAVRMSMLIPGLFQAYKVKADGQVTSYVDGGVLCNYPISCYDGWWLSMEKEDSFLQRMTSLDTLPSLFEKKERFGTYNEKTLGFLLYAAHEKDLLRHNLEKRKGAGSNQWPETKLREKYRKREEKVDDKREIKRKAVGAFLHALRKHNKDGNSTINRTELMNALNDASLLTEDQKKLLFGNPEEAMDKLDKNKDGEIHFNEINSYLEETLDHSLQAIFLGHTRRKNFKNCLSFAKALESTIRHNAQRLFVEDRDVDRTVGINTGYVGTTDFRLEDLDKDFIYKQGEKSTEVFLRYYVAKHNPPMKPEFNTTSGDNDSTAHVQTAQQEVTSNGCVYPVC